MYRVDICSEFMNNFRFDNRSGENRGSFRRDSGGRDSGRPQLHDAVCDECGKDCRVPFIPSGDKPVYCSECFEKKGGGRSDGRSNQRGSYKPRFNDRDSGRPSRGGGSVDFSQLTRNIEKLNSNLDRIIDLLGDDKKKEKKVKVEKAEKVKDSKPKVKAKKTVKKTAKKTTKKAVSKSK